MKTRGLTFLDLVDVLAEHGYDKLADLERMQPNPMLWTAKDWHFVTAIISRGTDIPEAEIKKKLPEAVDVLVTFNNVLRKTGLLVELEQVRKISERTFLAQKQNPWNTELNFK